MRIVFFDGNCPMCHAWIRRIIRLDKNKLLKFSSLEGEKALELLPSLFPDYLAENTIIFYNEGKLSFRSTAIMQIGQVLGFPHNIASIGWLVPKKIRDAMYMWVANRRYRYGKRYDSCPLPPPEWRDRFI